MKNKKISKSLLIIFITVSVLDIVGIIYANSIMQLIFKPLIIISLMALYYFSTENKNNWYLLALVFSFLGDVFLLDKNNQFIYGIASFLITQLLFIYIIVKQMEKPSNFKKYLYTFLFANYVVYLISLLKPNLGDLFYPVVVYGITIAIFGLVATLNYVTKRTTASLYLMLGSFIFIASDSMIALNKFQVPQKFYPVSIMITYVLAQYLIYRFFLINSNESTRKN